MIKLRPTDKRVTIPNLNGLDEMEKALSNKLDKNKSLDRIFNSNILHFKIGMQK